MQHRWWWICSSWLEASDISAKKFCRRCHAAGRRGAFGISFQKPPQAGWRKSARRVCGQAQSGICGEKPAGRPMLPISICPRCVATTFLKCRRVTGWSSRRKPSPRRFNPRPRAGGDRYRVPRHDMSRHVSIHAPAQGATDQADSTFSPFFRFQSTPPRRGRRVRSSRWA